MLLPQSATNTLVALGLPCLLAVSWDLLIAEALVFPRVRLVSWECLGGEIQLFDLLGYFARF